MSLVLAQPERVNVTLQSVAYLVLCNHEMLSNGITLKSERIDMSRSNFLNQYYNNNY